MSRLTESQISRLRAMDFEKIEGFTSANKMLDERYGVAGTPKREEFNAKAKAWYYGTILRDRRKELGLTQKEVADMASVQRAYIVRVEKGETDMQLSSFLNIANVLGIQIILNY